MLDYNVRCRVHEALVGLALRPLQFSLGACLRQPLESDEKKASMCFFLCTSMLIDSRLEVIFLCSFYVSLGSNIRKLLC